MKGFTIAAALLAVLMPGVSLAGWDDALAELKTEKQVKDLMHKGSILYVGVIDDGTRRDGYAQYVCQVLADHRVAAGTTVHVMDIVKITRDNDWKKLGTARCR